VHVSVVIPSFHSIVVQRWSLYSQVTQCICYCCYNSYYCSTQWLKCKGGGTVRSSLGPVRVSGCLPSYHGNNMRWRNALSHKLQGDGVPLRTITLTTNNNTTTTTITTTPSPSSSSPPPPLLLQLLLVLTRQLKLETTTAVHFRQHSTHENKKTTHRQRAWTEQRDNVTGHRC